MNDEPDRLGGQFLERRHNDMGVLSASVPCRIDPIPSWVSMIVTLESLSCAV